MVADEKEGRPPRSSLGCSMSARNAPTIARTGINKIQSISVAGQQPYRSAYSPKLKPVHTLKRNNLSNRQMACCI